MMRAYTKSSSIFAIHNIIEGHKRYWNDLGEIFIRDNLYGDTIYEKNNGEPFTSYRDASDYIYDVLDNDEDGNEAYGNSRYTTDEEGHTYANPDYIEDRFTVETDTEFAITNDIVRGVFSGILTGEDVDGVIFRNIYDTASSSRHYLSDVFVVPNDVNIKSATHNNGDFSHSHEIYRQVIGEIGARAIDRANGNNTLMDNLKRAKSMASAGRNPRDIKLATGWELGAYDKRWRYEIPDGDLRPNAKFHWYEQEVKYFGKLSYWEAKLADIFDAPELYRAYPQLMNLTVAAANKNGTAHYQSLYGEAWIDINPMYVDENGGWVLSPSDSTGHRFHNLRSALLHEIQHAIQNIEGFAEGGNPEMFKREFNDTKELRRNKKEELERKIVEIEELSGYNEFCKTIDPNIDFLKGAELNDNFWANSPYGQRYKQLQAQWRRVANDSPVQKYFRMPGEREARNIEARKDFTAQQRRYSLLSDTEDDSGRSRDENGQFYDELENEKYYQSANLHNNPLVELYPQAQTFANPHAEASYRKSHSPKKQKAEASHGIMHSLKQLIKGFRGDFPLLAGKEAKAKGLIPAREFLRIMNRNSEAKTHLALRSLYDSLHSLTPEQFDIFSRIMLLEDIKNFALANPASREHLPLGYNAKSLILDYKKFLALAQKDKAIWDAVTAEYNYNKKARQDLAALATRLGLRTLAKRISSNDLFLIQYADLIAHNEINSNYILAIGDMRTAMLQDIERLTALQKIKAKYDKKRGLISQFGDNWRLHIPSGYSIFNPMANGFIQSAQSLSDTVLGMALDEAGRQLGLSDKTMDNLRSKVSDKLGTQLMVLPDEITKTLNKLTEKKQRSELTQFVKDITTGWKKYTLYFITRAAKYNTRNITGDLDAALAGDPTCIRFLPKAVSELFTAYYGDQSKVSQELKDFQARGGALTFEAAQIFGDEKQLKEFNALIADIDAKGKSAWENLPRNAWKLIDKFAWSGIQKASDFREQWLRYAAYLDYLDQMQKNNGIPRNFGASVREEVMAIDDIRDRAFKLANELLGAYDQVSETGKQLRDILMPFYSWIEVNAKRYIQLIKNGLTEDDFITSKLPKALLAKVPGLGYKALKTWFFISLFSILVNAFNRFFFPDDEKKLPPDIQGRPHLTLGHDSYGNTLYFTQVGAVGDNLEWFGLNTFQRELRQIFNGQLTVTDWLKHMASAPFAKILNALNPFIKTPIELAVGKSLYPDFSNPRNIRDGWQYLAQSFGLSWPYRAITGQPRNDWHEFRNISLYSQDADEAAYYYTLSLVRQFKDKVLGQRFSGYSENKRTAALRKLRNAIRFNDKKAMQRALSEYYSQEVGGSEKGLKTSLRNMHPLFGISGDKLNQFSNWISPDDKPYIDRAQAYYNKLMRNFETGSQIPRGQTSTAQPARRQSNKQQPVNTPQPRRQPTRKQEEPVNLDELLRRSGL